MTFLCNLYGDTHVEVELGNVKSNLPEFIENTCSESHNGKTGKELVNFKYI